MEHTIPQNASGEEIIQNFDIIYTTNEIKICKLALPMLGKEIQPLAALLIKAMEFKYCYMLYTHTEIHSLSIEIGKLNDFLIKAKPYCNKEQKEVLMQIENVYNLTKNFEKLKDILDLADPSMFSQFDSLSNLFMNNQVINSPYNNENNTSHKNHSKKNLESLFQKTFNQHQKEIYEKFRKEYS